MIANEINSPELKKWCTCHRIGDRKALNNEHKAQKQLTTQSTQS